MVHTLLHLSLIHILMAMLPGPNTVAVSFFSMAHSRRAGLLAAAGVSAASLVWVTASLAGVGLLLMQAGGLFRLVRFLGAAYLIYVGVKMLRLQGSSIEIPTGGSDCRSAFVSGALTTLSNPKSAVFWTSIVSVLLPASPPLWFYGAVLAIIAIQSFGWYAAVALALSSPGARRHYTSASGAINRVAGAFMVFFGLKIVNDLRQEIASGI